MLGGGELFEGNVTFGTRTKSAFQLRLDTPVNGSPDTRAELAVFSIDRDLSYFASCMQHDKGVHATLRVSYLSLSRAQYSQLTCSPATDSLQTRSTRAAVGRCLAAHLGPQAKRFHVVSLSLTWLATAVLSEKFQRSRRGRLQRQVGRLAHFRARHSR